MKKSASKPVRALIYALLALFALVQVYPIVWVICSSLKDTPELMASASYALPKHLYFGHYIRALKVSSIPKAFLNSTIVAVLTLGLETVLACPFAYALSKLRFRAGPKVFSFVLVGMMIPTFVCLIPMFRMYNALGLRNTYFSLVLPQLGFGLPMSVYMYVSFMEYVPNSLMEVAEIDGASAWQRFIHIVVPMVKNATVTIITYKFIYVWNEFTYANTFMTDKTMKTLPIMLKDFAGEYGMIDWGPTYAAITMAILPTLIIYFFLSKNIIEGMALGAVKM